MEDFHCRDNYVSKNIFGNLTLWLPFKLPETNKMFLAK